MYSQSQSQYELNNALLEAAEDGSITEIQSLLDRHADIHALDGEDATPLHLASETGHHQCVELLLDRHANIHAIDVYDNRPLHFASETGHHQCVELLLDRHADINALNSDHETPLLRASFEGHHQCVEVLLDRHADPNAPGRKYHTPLHRASMNGHHQCIELLIDHGANKYLTDVRHCVPSLARSLLQPQYLACISHSNVSLSLSLRVDLSISRPSGHWHDTRTSRQDARDCSIDSRSRCVPLSLMLALSLSQSLVAEVD